MKSYVVGIDIGGTNTKLGIVDSRGTVLAKDSIKTNKHQCVEDYIEDLHKAFTALTRANGLEGEIGGTISKERSSMPQICPGRGLFLLPN